MTRTSFNNFLSPGVQLKFGFIKCFKCDFYIYHDEILDKVQGNLMPSFNVHTLRMKFQKLLDIMKDAQEYPDRQYVHSHCTVGKVFEAYSLTLVVSKID